MLPGVQSSLVMEFLSLEYQGVETGFQRPTVIRRSQKLFKSSGSDSPDDEESKSIIRICIAQSSAKLCVLQRITYFKKPFQRALGIWATALHQDVL